MNFSKTRDHNPVGHQLPLSVKCLPVGAERKPQWFGLVAGHLRTSPCAEAGEALERARQARDDGTHLSALTVAATAQSEGWAAPLGPDEAAALRRDLEEASRAWHGQSHLALAAQRALAALQAAETPEAQALVA